MFSGLLSTVAHPMARLIAEPEAALYWDFARAKSLLPVRGTATLTFTRTGDATYFDTSQLLQTAGTNAPRFDHDPVTGSPLGLRIEAAETNYVDDSNDFDNASWDGNSETTITESAATGPDGVSGSASQIEHTGTSGVGLFITVTGAPNGNAANSQVFYKIPAGSSAKWLRLAMANDGGSRRILQWFDMTTLTVGSDVTGSGSAANWVASMRQLPDGWVWVQTAWGNAGTSATEFHISIVDGDGSNAKLTGEPVYLYGADYIHEARSVGSHIPSSGGNTARNADLCSGTVSIGGEGSMVISATAPGSDTTSGKVVVELNDGADTNMIRVKRTSSETFQIEAVGSGAVAVTASEPTTWTNFTTAKIAVAWSDAQNKIQISVNGGTPIETAWTDAVSATMDEIHLGTQRDGSAVFRGWIGSLKQYNTAKFDAALQALST